jgi:hypothetical protein
MIGFIQEKAASKEQKFLIVLLPVRTYYYIESRIHHVPGRLPCYLIFYALFLDTIEGNYDRNLSIHIKKLCLCLCALPLMS